MRDTLSCRRRLAVAGITTLSYLRSPFRRPRRPAGPAHPAAPPRPRPRPPLRPRSGLPGRRRSARTAPPSPPRTRRPQIQTAIAAANAIHTLPYVWGGGHRSFYASGYDCSGAVSYVLHAAGLLASPMTSGSLATSWGAARQGPLDHGLRQRQPRLHGDRGQALRHLLRRRPLEPGLRPALAQAEAQAARLHRQVLPGLLAPNAVAVGKYKLPGERLASAGLARQGRRSDIPSSAPVGVIRCAHPTPLTDRGEGGGVAATAASSEAEPGPGSSGEHADVRLVGVSKRYGDVVAVDSLDLEVKRGEFFTLLGPSGLGQDHDAADDRRLRGARRRAGRARRPGRHRRAAVRPLGQHGLPGLRPLPPHDRRARTSSTGCG